MVYKQSRDLDISFQIVPTSLVLQIMFQPVFPIQVITQTVNENTVFNIDNVLQYNSYYAVSPPPPLYAGIQTYAHVHPASPHRIILVPSPPPSPKKSKKRSRESTPTKQKSSKKILDFNSVVPTKQARLTYKTKPPKLTIEEISTEPLPVSLQHIDHHKARTQIEYLQTKLTQAQMELNNLRSDLEHSHDAVKLPPTEKTHDLPSKPKVQDILTT